MTQSEVAIRDKRRTIPVLVPEAGASGMLAVIRSLGRAGYEVHACSGDATAIGLQSSFAHAAVQHPPYGHADFIDWLRHYVSAHKIRFIVPSEGFYIAIRNDYVEFADLLCVSSDEEIVYRCLSKADVAESFSRAPESHVVHRNLPRTLTGETEGDLAREAANMTFPLFAKSDAVHNVSGDDGSVVRIDSKDRLAEALGNLLKESRKILVQESAVGSKATYNVCRIDGEILAESMCLALHESPHTGGLTALRKTWWNEAMREDAIERLEFLDWNGVAMVEYKWCEASQTYTFIELNSRYWAALHLDLFAGTDFPKIQLDALAGLQKNYALGPQKRIVARMTFPADLGYTLSLVRDKNPSILEKIRALLTFFAGFLNPWLKSDFWFPGDRRLYLRKMSSTLRQLFFD